jgi:hypothetical protein
VATGVTVHNMDKFVPNPAASRPLHARVYAFVGKLMGIAIRGKYTLDLDFSSIVWKPLCGLPLDKADILAIDGTAFKSYETIQAAARIRSPDAKDDDIVNPHVHFASMSSDKREVDLKENGVNTHITWANREEYLKLEMQYRMTEFDKQVNAIKKGMSAIVPVQLLPLFTPSQLETMVCGKREVDIALLRQFTTCAAPLTFKHPSVGHLFEVLKSLSHQERRAFLRFVWGRNRLPGSASDFKKEPYKFSILDGGANPERLPGSHTCFFQIELPHYPTVEKCRNKVLKAINNCVSIANA